MVPVEYVNHEKYIFLVFIFKLQINIFLDKTN